MNYKLLIGLHLENPLEENAELEKYLSEMGSAILDLFLFLTCS